MLYGLINVNAATTVVSVIERLRPSDPESLKVALLRALRSLCISIADCAGTSLWGLGEERLEFVSEARAELSYVFSVSSLESLIVTKPDVHLFRKVSTASLRS